MWVDLYTYVHTLICSLEARLFLAHSRTGSLLRRRETAGQICCCSFCPHQRQYENEYALSENHYGSSYRVLGNIFCLNTQAICQISEYSVSYHSPMLSATFCPSSLDTLVSTGIFFFFFFFFFFASMCWQ